MHDIMSGHALDLKPALLTVWTDHAATIGPSFTKRLLIKSCTGGDGQLILTLSYIGNFDFGEDPACRRYTSLLPY